MCSGGQDISMQYMHTEYMHTSIFEQLYPQDKSTLCILKVAITTKHTLETVEVMIEMILAHHSHFSLKIVLM